MEGKKDYVPFRDPQDRAAVTRCETCGREVYGPEGVCLYCLAYEDDSA